MSSPVIQKRALTGPERLVWKRDVVCINIVLCASVTGSVRLDALQRAWSILQGKHPLLRAYLEEDGNDVQLSFRHSGQIGIREVTADSETTLESELITELQDPFSPILGQLLVRSVLLHTPDGAELIVTCHHCILDALSASYLLRDLLFCLSGQEVRIPVYGDTVVRDDMLSADSRISLPVKVGVMAANFFLSTLIPPMGHVEKIPVKESRVLLWNFSCEQTNALLGVCRKNGVTVHAAVSTVFQAAQHTLQGEKCFHKKIYTPVSVRNRLHPKVGESLGLFTTEVYVSARYDKKKSFWQNCRLVHDAVRKKTVDRKVLALLRIANCFKPAALDRLSVFVMKRFSSLYFGYIISNLGKLSFESEYGELQLKAMHGPVLYIPQAEKTLTLLTVNDQMFFTLSYQPDILHPEQAERIRDTAMELFEEIIATG